MLRATRYNHKFRIVKRANTLQYFMGNSSLKVFPILRRMTQYVVNFYSVLSSFQLFSQYDVLFSCIGEKKNQVNFFVLHINDFHHRLIYRSDSATSSYHQQSSARILVSLYFDRKVLMVMIPPALQPNFPFGPSIVRRAPGSRFSRQVVKRPPLGYNG